MNKFKSSKSLVSSQHTSSSGIIKPQLTSLIDVMTILLVFLLKSFSVEGNLITPSSDLTLAQSDSKTLPKPALNIEVTQKSINMDGKKIIQISELLKQDSLVIPELFDQLAALAMLFGKKGVQHNVMIQCDKEIDFKILKKVMFTCSKATFSKFSLLVNEKS